MNGYTQYIEQIRSKAETIRPRFREWGQGVAPEPVDVWGSPRGDTLQAILENALIGIDQRYVNSTYDVDTGAIERHELSETDREVAETTIDIFSRTRELHAGWSEDWSEEDDDGMIEHKVTVTPTLHIADRDLWLRISRTPGNLVDMSAMDGDEMLAGVRIMPKMYEHGTPLTAELDKQGHSVYAVEDVFYADQRDPGEVLSLLKSMQEAYSEQMATKAVYDQVARNSLAAKR